MAPRAIIGAIYSTYHRRKNIRIDDQILMQLLQRIRIWKKVRSSMKQAEENLRGTEVC
mgnify:CR=1 FL=1